MNPIEERENPRTLKEWWVLLGRPIFVGDRLKANLSALTMVSILSAILDRVQRSGGQPHL